MAEQKKELWLRLGNYHFEHMVPPSLANYITETFGGADASTKAFAAKLARKLGWEKGFALKAINEYRRFVYLGMISDFHVTPSKVIDQVWHEHQLFTRAYREFCQEVLGREFDHYPELVPTDDQTGVFQAQYIETIELYRREFNAEPPDDVWSVSKFNPRMVKTDGYEPRKKVQDSGALASDDLPLYLLLMSDNGHPSHPHHTEFGGGEFSGGGASRDFPSPESHPTSDHGSPVGDSGVSDGGGSAPSCGGGSSGCSSGCGGGGGD